MFRNKRPAALYGCNQAAEGFEKKKDVKVSELDNLEQRQNCQKCHGEDAPEQSLSRQERAQYRVTPDLHLLLEVPPYGGHLRLDLKLLNLGLVVVEPDNVSLAHDDERKDKDSQAEGCGPYSLPPRKA